MLRRRLPGTKTPEPVFKNPRVGNLFTKWRQVWLMAMERRRRLQDTLDRLNEVILLLTSTFKRPNVTSLTPLCKASDVPTNKVGLLLAHGSHFG